MSGHDRPLKMRLAHTPIENKRTLMLARLSSLTLSVQRTHLSLNQRVQGKAPENPRRLDIL
jgi:hypothetical protein